MNIQNTPWQSATQIFPQNNSSSLYSAQEDKPFVASNKETKTHIPSKAVLENFSEKAMLIFENLSVGLSRQERGEVIGELNSIGKAAAFSSINGFESQRERMLVNQYFENFGGVISDEAIKKMIFSKLDNPNSKNRDFLKSFAQALDEPLQSINIRV